MLSESTYRQLVAQSPDCIIELDVHGRILLINEAGAVSLGGASPSLVGSEWAALWPLRMQAAVRAHIEYALEGTVGRFTEAFPTLAHETRRWAVTVSPILQANSAVERILIVGHDVTERVHVEEALETINRMLNDKLLKASVSAAVESDRYQVVAERLRRAELTSKHIEEGAVAMATRANIAEAARVIAEEMALQAQRSAAIGQLAAGIAHDFNNMLQTATLGLSMLNDTPDLAQPVRVRLVQNCLGAVQRASVSARRMMNFTRVHKIEVLAVDLQQLVNGLVGFIDQALGPKMVVNVHPYTGATTAFIDAHAVEQALMNLLINARDACENEGVIDIRFGEITETESATRHYDGDFITVRITDSGQGMNHQTRERLFEPYFTTKAEGRGSGLGLAQVYGLMLQLLGYVEVESEPGHGSTFTLAFRKVRMDTKEIMLEPSFERDNVKAPHRRSRYGKHTD